MTERVIVIDPGERVGWCRAHIVDGEIVPDTFAVGVHPLKQFALALIGKTIVPAACDGEVEYDTLVYEKWALYASHAMKLVGSEMASSQLVGIIRACGWVSGARLAQLPANKKSTGIKVMPQWLQERRATCTEEHSKDACDLLAYYHHRNYIMKGRA